MKTKTEMIKKKIKIELFVEYTENGKEKITIEDHIVKILFVYGEGITKVTSIGSTQCKVEG